MRKNMVAHINKLQDHGFAPCRGSVRGMAFDLAEKLEVPTQGSTRKTKKGVLRRVHSLLEIQTCQLEKLREISVARAIRMSKQAVMEYFDLFERVLTENNLWVMFSTWTKPGLQLNN